MKEKYLESIRKLLQTNTKIEKIKNGVIQDCLNDKISAEIYAEAIKIIEEEKLIKSKGTNSYKETLKVNGSTDPKKVTSSMREHHLIELLPKEDEKEKMSER